MNVCSNADELKKFIMDCGVQTTGDVFIVLGNVYMRLLTNKITVEEYPGNVVIHRWSQSNQYLCWCYKTYVRRYIDYDRFKIQFEVFKFVFNDDERAHDDLIKEIIDNDLTTLAILSEHMF